MKHKQKGFTLIELLIVIAIIGLLASVVLVSLSNARAKAKDAKRLADVRQYMSALELYYNTNNSYPVQATAQALVPGITTGAGLLATGGFISAFQAAPLPVGGTCTVAQNTYTYTSANGAIYSITFCLGAATGAYAAGLRTAGPNGIR